MTKEQVVKLDRGPFHGRFVTIEYECRVFLMPLQLPLSTTHKPDADNVAPLWSFAEYGWTDEIAERPGEVPNRTRVYAFLRNRSCGK